MVEVDGHHLKGLYKGILPYVLLLDRDKGMFPLAIAIMKVMFKKT